jgi:fatty-acyl-CoA synthase
MSRYALLETADYALLDRPLRSLADVEAIERTPLAERLQIVDFSRRMEIALASRDQEDTAISYVPDGDVGRAAEEVSFRELRSNIARTSALLRSCGYGRAGYAAGVWQLLNAFSLGN